MGSMSGIALILPLQIHRKGQADAARTIQKLYKENEQAKDESNFRKGMAADSQDKLEVSLDSERGQAFHAWASANHVWYVHRWAEGAE